MTRSGAKARKKARKVHKSTREQGHKSIGQRAEKQKGGARGRETVSWFRGEGVGGPTE
ncbi:MAG: hypothetical protein JSW38_03845 [Dehalococcoidia bacterium]|nr:MAG: hypothetical protein JSW38_03845 [Dehalococcoidia bacterium]